MKKSLLKKLLLLLLTLATVLVLAACGQSKGDSDLSYVKKNGKLIIGYTVYSP